MAKSGKKPVLGWLLNEKDRKALLKRFPPAYPDVIAHHVTLQFDAPRTMGLPLETRGEIVGLADDGEGVQALVVRIGDTTDRPGGGTYHITWSLDRAHGRTPKDSNTVIEQQGWQAVDPIFIRLTPARF
jgi:hypothetical protein